MGYVLLWIETLAVSLLLVATLTAVVARFRWRWARSLVWISVTMFLLLFYVLSMLAAFGLRSGRLVTDSLFLGVASLTVVYVVFVLWIRLRPMRRLGERDSPPAAAGWHRGKLALAFGVAVALNLMTSWNLDLAMRQQMAAIRAEAGAMAMAATPARIPDADNAALVYGRVFEWFEADESRRKPWVEQWEARNAEDDDFDYANPDLQRLVEQDAPVLDLLRQAASLPGCRFEQDYLRTNLDVLPELGHMRMASRMLTLTARNRSARGDFSGAVQDVNALFSIAAHAGGGTSQLWTQVGVALHGMAVVTAEEVLASASGSPDVLAAIKIDDCGSHQKRFRRALRLEEALCMATMCQLGGQQDRMAPAGGRGPDLPNMGPLFRVFAMSNQLAEHRRIMEEYGRLASMPYHRAYSGWESHRSMPKHSLGGIGMGIASVLTRLLGTSIAATAESAARGDAYCGTAVAGVAMYHYRATHGRFPEKLDDLVPEFLFEVPQDPFDGAPLKLKQAEGGPVVYSIGPDMTDDGGVPLDDERTGDVTFTLAD